MVAVEAVEEAGAVDVVAEDEEEDVGEDTIRTLWLVHMVQIPLSRLKPGITIERNIKLYLSSNKLRFNSLKLQLGGSMALHHPLVLHWTIEVLLPHLLHSYLQLNPTLVLLLRPMVMLHYL